MTLRRAVLQYQNVNNLQRILYTPYFIADIAANHDGVLIEQKLIQMAAEAGANAVKFQNFLQIQL